MTIYEAVEYITEDLKENNNGENASGMYSTADKARAAILARIAEEYDENEIAAMNIPQTDWEYLEVPSNDWVAGCTYIIYSYELDERMG